MPLVRATPKRCLAAEDLFDLVRCDDFELLVGAVGGFFVGAPAAELGGVTKTIALHVFVSYLRDQLRPQRFPRQILPRTPPALRARNSPSAIHLTHGPRFPRMLFQSVLAIRLEKLNQFDPLLVLKTRAHDDVMQKPLVVKQTQQQRTNARAFAFLVPA